MFKKTSTEAMSGVEKRSAMALASVYAIRMFGLFTLLPVLSLFGRDLPQATPLLIGLAIGIYGFTQALLQIPLGMLSDRWGRKRVITLGLLVFTLGSFYASVTNDIYDLIIARALQGAGAIAAVIMALVADLSREQQRTKMMAFVGASIGGSFILALVAGPVLAAWVGVPGLFQIITLSGLVGILLIWFAVPAEPAVAVTPRKVRLVSVLADTELFRLNSGIFVLHLLLTAAFLVVPLMLQDQLGLAKADHSWVYLGVMLASFVVMVPLIIIAERQHRHKQIILVAAGLMLIALLVLGTLPVNLLIFLALLWIFFIGFNVLEASLPSWVSKRAPGEHRGVTMGVYATFQFLGAFVGGAAGGYMYGQGGAQAVFIMGAVLISVWFVVAFGLKSPKKLQQQTVNIQRFDGEPDTLITRRFLDIPGVRRVVLAKQDGVAYLAVDDELDPQYLQQLELNQQGNA